MRPPTLRASFDGELVVDSFAGGGGASTGIEAALGRPVDIAINHSAAAIAMHRANHPDTTHYTCDVWEVCPREATQGRPVGLAWFSPACTHFSRAKGTTNPLSAKIRSLAWVVVRWAKAVRPRVLFLENVEEFEQWGPLGHDGRPDPSRLGRTFRQWVGRLRALGYAVEFRSLVAADYGAPTTRKRLFMIARCDGAPIVWPATTHGRGRARGWVPASEIIDWTLPAPSIFDRAKPLADATLVREGRDRRGEARAFLMAYYGAQTGQQQSLFDPLHTVTTKARFGLVEVHGRAYEIADIGMRMLAPHELFAAQGFPASYIIDRDADGDATTKTAQIRLCGNSVCPPVAQALVSANFRHGRGEVAA